MVEGEIKKWRGGNEIVGACVCGREEGRGEMVGRRWVCKSPLLPLQDFPVLLLHHTVTISLLLISYTINMVPIGLVIALLHDVADIFLEVVVVGGVGREKGRRWGGVEGVRGGRREREREEVGECVLEELREGKKKKEVCR